MSRRKLSLILPTFRGGSAVDRAVERLGRELSPSDQSWEVIVVDDGGGDVDEARLRSLQPRVRLIRFPKNRGKGAAVRAGMLAAEGDVRVYTDIDIPYGVRAISDVAHYILARGFHVVVGDRTLKGSSYSLPTSIGRRTVSNVSSALIGRLVTGGFFDTQCGLKGFRGDIAQELFQLVRIDRFAFDVEVLYVCLKHRLDIKRMPVRLENNSGSSVRLIRDTTRSAVDILRLKVYQTLGLYANPVLEDIVSREYFELHSHEKSPY